MLRLEKVCGVLKEYAAFGEVMRFLDEGWSGQGSMAGNSSLCAKCMRLYA